MSVQHRIAESCVTDGSSSLNGSVTEVGSSEIAIDQTYAAASTDESLSVSFSGADLQSIFLVASQNLTIEVDSGSSPTKTISLVANVPFKWSVSPAYFTNPFNALTSTTWYITCTAAARLRGKILLS